MSNEINFDVQDNTENLEFEVEDIQYIPVPGPPGPEGKSAYEVAVEEGYIGTEEEWLASLVGPAGPSGSPGIPGKDGSDGFSPEVEVTQITGGHKVEITDAEGKESFNVMDGVTGPAGPSGSPGSDGFSPVVSTQSITGGTRVNIQDSTHTESFDLLDGKDGQPGSPGAAGSDGVSPAVTITQITDGHRINITDKDHPSGQSFDVMDGSDGQPGSPGNPGSDGVSPEVTISTITGGHRVNITDAEHPSGQNFDVMDGATGPAGPSGSPGSDGTRGGIYIDCGQSASSSTSKTIDGVHYYWRHVYSDIVSHSPSITPAVGDSYYAAGYLYTIDCIAETSGTVYAYSIDRQSLPAGSPGQDGSDGFSPAVTITSITGGHQVNITDKTHPSGQNFDVMDGSTGPAGPKGDPGELTILKYGTSTWNDFITAYNSNNIVYCRASSNANPASGSQTRLAFMAYVNNETSPTEVEFQYYRSVNTHSDSQQGDQVFVYKLTSAGTWTVTTRNTFTKIVAGTGLSSTWVNGVLTLNLDLQTWQGGSY